jgi:uncharacterized DUF497 family protein
MKFEWNKEKASANLTKHGVSFDEAKSVFYDDFAIQFYDQIHSIDEDRFLMLGLSDQFNLLLVSHCERNDGKTIRIISARKATISERTFYRGS